MKIWFEAAPAARQSAPVAWGQVMISNRGTASPLAKGEKEKDKPKSTNNPSWGGDGIAAKQEFLKKNWMYFDPGHDDIRVLENTTQQTWDARRAARKLGPLFK